MSSKSVVTTNPIRRCTPDCKAGPRSSAWVSSAWQWRASSPIARGRAAANEKLSIVSPATNGGGTSIEFRGRLEDARTANELYLPVGVPVRINLNSNDVIHSFWVPSLAGKQDLIPGRDNDSPSCREDRRVSRPVRGILRHSARPHGAGRERRKLSGLHQMVGQQLQPAQRHTAPLTQAGYKYVTSGPCSACHTIGGTRRRHASGLTSPTSPAAAASPPAPCR